MVKEPQFVTNRQGRRVSVLLDIKSYERLLAAAEESADLKSYRKAKPRVDAEIERGEFVTLAKFRRRKA